MLPQFTSPIQSFSLNSRLVYPTSLLGCQIDTSQYTTGPKLKFWSSHQNLLHPQPSYLRWWQLGCFVLPAVKSKILEVFFFFSHFKAHPSSNPVCCTFNYIQNNFSPLPVLPPYLEPHGLLPEYSRSLLTCLHASTLAPPQSNLTVALLFTQKLFWSVSSNGFSISLGKNQSFTLAQITPHDLLSASSLISLTLSSSAPSPLSHLLYYCK